MKNRKNILTYIVAAAATLVTSVSSSLGAPPFQSPQNYTGRLTHNEFLSCEGQIQNTAEGEDALLILTDGTYNTATGLALVQARRLIGVPRQ
jgi:hypothetical protein